MKCDECRWKVERDECPWEFMYENSDYAEDCVDFHWVEDPRDIFSEDK